MEACNNIKLKGLHMCLLVNHSNRMTCWLQTSGSILADLLIESTRRASGGLMLIISLTSFYSFSAGPSSAPCSKFLSRNWSGPAAQRRNWASRWEAGNWPPNGMLSIQSYPAPPFQQGPPSDSPSEAHWHRACKLKPLWYKEFWWIYAQRLLIRQSRMYSTVNALLRLLFASKLPKAFEANPRQSSFAPIGMLLHDEQAP